MDHGRQRKKLGAATRARVTVAENDCLAFSHTRNAIFKTWKHVSILFSLVFMTSCAIDPVGRLRERGGTIELLAYQCV